MYQLYLFSGWVCWHERFFCISSRYYRGHDSVHGEGFTAADNPEFYVPAETTVKAGETVTWKNDDTYDDTAIHTATSRKDATPDGRIDTSLVSPGQGSKPITIPNEPGQYPYFCTLHPWMEGTITVT